MPERITILGVPIDNVTLAEAVDCIAAMAKSNEQHHVMTPNPEMLVAAHRDPAFQKVLQSSALNIPDGTGLLWAAKRIGTPLRERVTGVDLVEKLCGQSGLGSIFFLGAAPGIAESAANILRTKNSALNIAGTFAGSPSALDEIAIIEKITQSGATILFVAYGAPAQDVWIARNLKSIPNVRVAMGVGGSFDFLAGKQKRAPSFMRSLGIEWLWRVFKEPKRIGRIWNAVVVFPWLVMTKATSR